MPVIVGVTLHLRRTRSWGFLNPTGLRPLFFGIPPPSLPDSGFSSSSDTAPGHFSTNGITLGRSHHPLTILGFSGNSWVTVGNGTVEASVELPLGGEAVYAVGKGWVKVRGS